jgi:O-antigen/teichoic acid export membrane protein
LLPEAFGLMALASGLVAGFQLFTDIGIGPSVIQNRNGEDPRFLNTAWTLQVLRGFAVWLCSALAAWPVAYFYGAPVLGWLIPAIGATAAIGGLDSTSLHVLARRVRRAPLVLLQVGTYVAGMAATFAWLLFVSADVWGFVVGSFVAGLLTLVLSHWLLDGPRNRPHWDKAFVGELITFGRWIFVSTLCGFLMEQGDRFVIGKLTSLTTLGVYQIARQLNWMAAAMLCGVASQILLPLYSRRLQAGQAPQAVARGLHPLMGVFCAVVVTGMLTTGPALVNCLYGARYAEAGWMLQVLAVGTWLRMLITLGNAALWGGGNSRSPAAISILSVATLAVAMPLGYSQLGLAGLLLGLVLMELVAYAATVGALRHMGVGVLGYDVPLTLGIALIAWAADTLGRHPWVTENKWLELLSLGGATVLLWALVALGAWGLGLLSSPAKPGAGGEAATP